MNIYFLRHASAGERRMNPKKDEKRPLDREGIQQCYQVGRMLAAMETVLDAVISSPLKRAAQTAALVANEMGHDGKVHVEDALRPEATYERFREMLRKYSKAESILVVGHNPNFSEFLSRSIEMEHDSYIELRKGAIARVEENARAASLHWLVTPRVVRAVVTAAATEAATIQPKKKVAEKVHMLEPALQVVDLRKKKKLSRTERALLAFAKKKVQKRKKPSGKKRKKAGGKKHKKAARGKHRR